MGNNYPTPIGEKFGLLTVIGEAPRTGANRKVMTRCDCGAEKALILNNLRTGHTKSCGCDRYGKNAKHGHASRSVEHATYSIYRDMRTRCENPNYREFHLYGGRGITVCERWREGYEFFLADMGVRPESMTLDRIDSDGEYSPDNCRWADIATQSNNRRSNVRIEYLGKSQTVRQWCSELRIDDKMVYARLARGWEAVKAITEPVRPHRKSI